MLSIRYLVAKQNALIITDKRDIKMVKDRHREVERYRIKDFGERVVKKRKRSANAFLSRVDRTEKEISGLRRRVHARGNKKMTASDRGRLLYSIQLLFRLDRINFKKRFKKKILLKNKLLPSSMQRVYRVNNFFL